MAKKIEKMTDREMIKELLWMARRYADGRMTSTPSLFNEIQKVAVDKYGIDIIGKRPGTTENFPYAIDGSPTVDAVGDNVLPDFSYSMNEKRDVK